MTTKCTTNYINLKYNISINEKVGVDLGGKYYIRNIKIYFQQFLDLVRYCYVNRKSIRKK